MGSKATQLRHGPLPKSKARDERSDISTPVAERNAACQNISAARIESQT
jgi:hypothetical protein